MLWPTRRQRHWERFIVTMWHSYLFLTYCESQIMTLRILRASQRVTWTAHAILAMFKNKSKNNIQSIHTKCEIDKVLRKCSKASAIRCYWAHQDCWEPWPPTPGAGIWTQRKSIRNSWRKFEVDFRQGYTYNSNSLRCWEIYLSATVKRSMVVRKLCCSIDYL